MSWGLGFLLYKLAIWARFGPDLANIWPRFEPNSVHLTNFVTGVGSGNLIGTDSGTYFQKRTMSQSSGFLLSKLVVLAGFGPNLTQIWPNLAHLKAWKGWHYVIPIKPMPWAKRASLYNHNWYFSWIWLCWTNFGQFWPDLAQIWPIFALV